MYPEIPPKERSFKGKERKLQTSLQNRGGHYQYPWKAWMHWCSKQYVDPIAPNEVHIVN